jgi:predicted DNA-binding WGR domain protein
MSAAATVRSCSLTARPSPRSLIDHNVGMPPVAAYEIKTIDSDDLLKTCKVRRKKNLRHLQCLSWGHSWLNNIFGKLSGVYCMWQWVNLEKRRYYQAELVRDLFGDWVLIKVWGSLGASLGGQRITVVANHETGIEAIRALDTRRKKRGYVSVETFANWRSQVAERSKEPPFCKKKATQPGQTPNQEMDFG